MAVVELAPLDLVGDRCQVLREIDDEPVDMVRPVAAVVRVPLEHDPLPRNELGDVVRPGARHGWLDALEVGRQCGRKDAAGVARHQRREDSQRPRQPDDQPVSLHNDAGGSLGFPTFTSGAPTIA